jgi:hypothetical protein
MSKNKWLRKEKQKLELKRTELIKKLAKTMSDATADKIDGAKELFDKVIDEQTKKSEEITAQIEADKITSDKDLN